MADAPLTMLDIAKRNGHDAIAGIIDEVSQAHPEVSGRVLIGNTIVQVPGVGAARTIMGRQYKTLIRTGLPSVAFRDANNGTDSTKSSHEERLVETFIMSPNWWADKAVADSSEDGWQAVMAEEADAHLQGAIATLGTQFYYGRNGGDGSGCPGLLDVYDSTNMEVDAGGSTAKSSVWLVKFGPKYVQWVFGQGGTMTPTDVTLQRVTGSNSKELTAYFQELNLYPGLQCKSLRASCRIKNLGTDAGKGLTDDLIYSALSKFEPGIVPDAIFMTRRSQEQLRASRTATNATGQPAPTPDSVAGIPIAVTGSITESES